MSETIDGRVRVEVEALVARVTLVRPDAGNALDLAMAVALRNAGQFLSTMTGLRMVRVDAEGDFFCVGGDLREFAAAEDPAAHVAAVAEAAHAALRAFRELTVPVLTVVQGAAAGAGLGLALLGDVVLASRQARFRVAYTAAGLSPDCGVSFHLATSLPRALAMDLTLTNRSFSAEQAETWGLISRAVDGDALSAAADEISVGLVEGSATALSATCHLMHDGRTTDWDRQLDAEAASIARLAGGPDAKEGIAAFLAKRRPQFMTT